jgi:hypothetical protein
MLIMSLRILFDALHEPGPGPAARSKKTASFAKYDIQSVGFDFVGLRQQCSCFPFNTFRAIISV